jgi:hypothetical protein
MSEFKGQLLSMILVLAIFSAISGVLIGSFKKAAAKVGEDVGYNENGIVVNSSSASAGKD